MMQEKDLKWTLVSSEYVFEDTWLKARKDICKKPDGTIVNPYYVLEYMHWVTGLGLTEDGKIIMIKQYRHALGEVSLELPGGCVDEIDASFEAAMKREMLEETGYQFKETVYLGDTSPNPSTNNNLMHMYLLKGGRKVQEQELDANEEIEVMLMPIEELIERVKRNEIIQSMHVTTIFYALQYLGKLNL